MPQTEVEDLAAALDAIFDALRSGSLGALGEFASTLQSDLDGLALTDADALELIRRKAQRNLACLEAAARGVRSARRRLAELRGIESGVATYDAQGRRDEGLAVAARLAQRL